MAITLKPGEAFAALKKRIESDDPVIGTFKLSPGGRLGTPHIMMQVVVEGRVQDFEFALLPDGRWDAQLNKDL